MKHVCRNAAVLLIASLPVVAPRAADQPSSIRAWRIEHERDILSELTAFLSIPNVATDKTAIVRNAGELKTMLERRRARVVVVETTGSPVVIGQIELAGATRTITLYCHYDGQPVDAREWATGDPFTPTLYDARLDQGGKPVMLPPAGPINPEWRLYARSASDDKGEIVAILSALDAIRATRVPPTSNVRFIFEGDEEAGSPVLAKALTANADDVGGDIVIMIDGPRHASGRPTMYFGTRGIVSVEITVYGAKQDLHSGNYGNWAPNPALALSRLLASMKDDTGHVTIAGFYDDVTPLSATEKEALADIPDLSGTLKRGFGFARPDNPGRTLEELHNLPTLNINGLRSGTVGGQGRTIVPGSATASLDLRFVKDVAPDRQFERLVAHVRKEGFEVIEGEPTEQQRARFPWPARVVRRGGYPAGRTSMDLPIAKSIVVAVTAAAAERPVRLPTLGGSAPFYIFTDLLKVPALGLPIANFDNNQHGPNENLRLQNLWDGIDQIAAVLTMPPAPPPPPARR